MENVEGLLLAGGKSSRMGGLHKGSLRLETETFAEHLVQELKKEAGQVWISYGETLHETYAGCKVVRDRYPDCGPIGGLQAGFSAAGQDLVLVAACDLPLLTIELYRELLRCMEAEEARRKEQLDGAVPVLDGRIHPLAAVYRKSAAAVMEEQLQQKEYRVRKALEKLKILYVDLSGKTALAGMLQNINTPEEYRAMRRGGDGTCRN